MNRIKVAGLLAGLFCLLSSFSVNAQLRVDDRVPADKKAVIAVNIDIAALYKNKMVKMLADEAMKSPGNSLPFKMEDMTKMSAFVAAPSGIDLISLSQTNFYIYFGFKNETATSAMKELLMSEGGREVELGGKKLIGPPDGEPFYVDIQPRYIVVGTADYLTSPSNQFATQGLSAAYSALPKSPIRIAVDFDGARELMDQLSQLANANADFLTKPYVSLIDEISSMAITSDLDNGSLLKISMTGHDEAEGGKIKQKMDALLGMGKQFLEAVPTGGPGSEMIDETVKEMIEAAKKIEAKQSEKTVTIAAPKPAGFEKMVTGAFGAARAAASNASDLNTFKQVLLAMHNYHDVYGELPFVKHSAAEDSGKGLSWTVFFLPFMEQSALYETFDLNGNYDSPQNAKAARTELQALKLNSGGKIMWVRPTKVPAKFSNITDGLSNTVAFVQSKKIDMSPWSQAKSITPDEVLKQFKALKPGEAMIFGIYDGSVRRITSQDDVANVEAMLEPADGKAPSR